MKMFINRKHTATHTLSLIASLALALTSCVQLGEEQEGAYGYLTISGFDVDVQVEQLLPTKAGETVDISTVPGYFAPTLSSVTVTSASDQEKSYTWKYGDANLKLPAGTYSLSATSGSNGFGEPYYVGTGTVTVVAGQEVTGKVEFTLGNSVMKVTNGMPEHFTVTDGTTVTISSGDKSVQTTMTENVTGYVFVPSDKNLKVEVKGKSAAGVDKPFSQNLKTATTAGCAHNVVITKEGADLPVIKLEEADLLAWGDRIFIIGDVEVDGDMSSDNINNVVYEAISASSNDWSNPEKAEDGVIKGLEPDQLYKVRARIGGLASDPITLTPSFTGLSTTVYHTDTNGDADGGDLDGTDVKTTFTSPHTKVTELEPNWSFALYKEADVENNQVKANATSLRTYNDFSDGSSITAANGWPYLPQGDYKLVATATLKDGATVSSMSDIEVPAPSFTVGTGAYTSYSKYISGDISAANTCDAGTIYDIQGSVTPAIASSLLSNENYKKITNHGTSTVLLDGEAPTSNIITSQTWGEHTVTVSYTFDNTTCTNAHTLHITGLPYKPENMVEKDWELSSWNCEYDNGTIQLGGVSGSGECTATSKMDFHIPENINIKINTNVSVRDYKFGLIWVETAFTLFVNEKSVISQDGNRQDNNNTGKNYNLSGNSSFTTNSCSIKLNSSYEAAGPWSKVHSLHILYN